VSKRHQQSRRRAYGRRQHEVRERLEHSHPSELLEFDLAPDIDDRDGFPFRDLDLGTRRVSVAMGD
jgi:hypothetical protein